MRSVSIRARVTAALLLMIAVALGAVLLIQANVFKGQIEASAAESLAQSRHAFDTLQMRDTTMLSAVLDSIMSRPDIREALARRDRARLLSISAPLFADLKARYGITHLYFITPDGVVLLRVHKPSQFGDKLKRVTFLEAQRGGGYGAGLELGATAYALRVVHNVRSTPASGGALPATSGAVIGYIETGEEIDHFLTAMKRQSGDDVGLLLAKSSLSETAWAQMRAGAGAPDDWSQRPTMVLAASTTTRNAEEMNLAGSPATLPANGIVEAIAREDSRTELRGVFPVRDAAGRQDGAVYVDHDLTPIVSRLSRARFSVAVILAITMVFIALATLLLLNRLIFDRLSAMISRLHEGTQPASPAVLALVDDEAFPADEIGNFERELTRNRAELEFKSGLLDRASDAVIVRDLSNRLLYANESAARGFGYSRDEYLASGWESTTPLNSASFGENMAQVVEDGHAVFETEACTKDGTQLPVEVSAQLIEANGHQLIASVGRDLTERKKAERLVERLAYYDPLTGLANRRLLEDRLTISLSQARRRRAPLALMFVDIDRLKGINDALGHTLGDDVIRAVGQRLSEEVREGDTVARLGGDEFIMLCPDCDRAAAEALGRRALASIQAPITVDGHDVRVTVSIGASIYERGDTSGEDLLRQADLAMYEVKRGGGDGLGLHEASMSEAAAVRFQLERDLRKAFDERRLELHYQPVVRVEDRKVVGFEALLRWTDEARGAVPPSVFVPLAEDNGLILSLGSWVIAETCRQARVWRDAGLPPFRMAVNLSVRQLVHGDLVEVVRHAIGDTGMEASCLELEITESIALHPSPQVRETLDALRGLGVSISIDDFGVGYSSFSALAELGVQRLKIDRSFVHQMTNATESAAIVRAILDLGRHLDLIAVAEGVEHQDQLDLLRELGCAEVQGYLFSRALPPSQVPAWLAENPPTSGTEGEPDVPTP